MIIKQKSVRSVERYFRALQLSSRVRLVYQVQANDLEKLVAIGFGKELKDGETVLPGVLGRVSEFNAEGREVTLKSEPKERRYITTLEWTWEQWCGGGGTETVTESRDIYRDCYPREFMPPPALELTCAVRGTNEYIVSPIFNFKNMDIDGFKHAVNLFLELFGECEIRQDNLSTLAPPKIKRLNWELLPPGKHPWERVQQHTKALVASKHSKYSNIILARQDKITSYAPDEVYVGTGGFSSYVAYVFKSKKIVVLESILTGNATYIFDENWQQFSMLTKAEILDNAFQEHRLIHSKGWEFRLESVLDANKLKVA